MTARDVPMSQSARQRWDRGCTAAWVAMLAFSVACWLLVGWAVWSVLL